MQKPIEYGVSEGSQSHTAYEVELALFRQLLALGPQLLRLFFLPGTCVRPPELVHASDGTRLEYHDLRATTYFSLFGKMQFPQRYFHAPGSEGPCPLDAERLG